MKKFLALVLALVMTMSLVTIAGAEDYTDNASITYEEAVDVVSAVGIVGGYADGSFNPTAGLTRGAAAKIICNMILGPTTAEALVANEAPYSDVAVDNVFAGYIAFCAKEGIVSGYADGTFKPAAPLTGYAFMKMLLGALGYDATIEGYTGANWSINVAKRALKVGLDKGLVGEFVGSKALTREEAALYAFNTLKAIPVKYEDKGTNITIGDLTINTGATAAINDGSDEYYKVLFGTKLVAGPATTTDDFGRPATAWTYKGEELGTYAKTADYVYTGSVKAGDVYKDMGKVDVEKVETINNLLSGTSAKLDITSTHNIVKDSTAQFGLGNCVIEFFVSDVDEDSDKEVLSVCIEYGVDEIKKVNDVKYDKDGDVKTKANVVLKNTGKTFETTGFEKEEIVLYALVNGAVKDLIAADSFEGKVTAVKGDKITVGGAAYKNTSTAALGSEGTFYLGVDGSVVYFDGVSTASEDYAYIYNTSKKTDSVNADGLTEATIVTVYAVLEDGTKVSYVATEDLAKALLGEQLNGSLAADGVVVAYKIKDGKMDLGTLAANKQIAQMDSNTIGKTVASNGTYYFSNNTDYVFVNINNTDKTVSTNVVTGYKNVAEQTAKVARIYDTETKLFEVVFVLAEAAESTSDKTFAVLLDNAATVTEDDDNTYYTYAVSIEGNETTLTWKNTDKASSIVAGDVFEYTLKGAYINTAVEQTLTQATANDLIADYVVLDNAPVYVNDDAEIYLAEVEDGVYTLTETEIAKDDVVKYFVVGGNGDDKDEIAFALVTRAD